MSLLFRLVSLAVLVGVAHQPQVLPELRSGDIVLQASKSERARLIRRASDSPYSHVGLVEVAPDGVFVIEAIEPVSRTPFKQWQARGIDQKITVLRARALDGVALQSVVTVAKSYLGTHYDARYQWGDDRLYCSELVVKAFSKGAGLSLGHLQPLASLHLKAAELKEAKALGIASDTNLVTPQAIAVDAQVETVFSDF